MASLPTRATTRTELPALLAAAAELSAKFALDAAIRPLGRVSV